MSKIGIFIEKNINDVLKKINKQMKELGIVYLYDTENNFYHPSDNDIVHYHDVDEYVTGNYTEQISKNDLVDIIPETSDDEYDFSHFTSKEKLNKFIESGFDALKKKQRLEYIRYQKNCIRNKIHDIENTIHYKNQELDEAKSELEDFEIEEKSKIDCIE